MKSVNLCLSRSASMARALFNRRANDHAFLRAPTARKPGPEVPRWWQSIMTLALSVLVVSLLQAFPKTARGADTPTYLLNEGFEGAGFENPGWTKVGTPDEDYAAVALDGLQSLRCLGGQQISRPFAFSNSFNLYCKVRFLSLPTFQGLVFWRNASGNTVAELYFNNTFGNVELIHGTTIVTSSNLFVANTTYDLWIEWTKGSGSDGTMKLYVATDGIKPQSPQVSIANGTGGAMDRFIVGPENPARGDVVFDLIMVADVPIGDNPGGSQNHPPSISRISNQTITEGRSTGPLGFTVDDVETAPESLLVFGSSSNPTLVPNSNIVFAGAGRSRNVTVSPAANQNGTATITLAVSDGQATNSSTFTLVVQPATGPTYLLSEDFEGPGFENSGWSRIGAPDEDYTGFALHGAQSLNCLGGQRIYRTFPFPDSFYLYFKVRFVALPTYQSLIDWRDHNLTRVAQFYVNGGTVNLTHGSVFARSVTAFATNLTYDLWIEWSKGTGADGVFKLFAATNGIKPELPEINITTGDGGSVDRMDLGPESSGNVIIDQILVDDVPIGSMAEPNQNAPGTLTIQVDDATRLYGSADPNFTGQLLGLQSGDQITATYTSTATRPDPVGNYRIVPLLSDPQGRLTNYTVITNGGTLTITPAPLEVRADDQSRPYGAGNPRLTGSITGIRNGDSITALYSTAATPTNTPGTYAITPVVSDWNNRLSNYVMSIHNGLLAIYPAGLIGKADDKTRMVGEDNPPFTVSYSGFVNGEDRSIVTGTLSGFSPANVDSPPGTYPITLSGQTAPNYNIEYQPGILTVRNLELLIQVSNATRSYGATNPPFSGTVTGIENGDNITVSYRSSGLPGSPVGTYSIEAVISDPDNKLRGYNVIVHNGTLTVTPARLVGKADDKTRAYGQTNPVFTVTYSGFVNNENSSFVTGSLRGSSSAGVGSPPGSYPISVDGQSAPNYSIEFQSGTLTVTTAELTVTADNKSRAVAMPNPPLTGTMVGVQNHDNITATYSTTATALSLPGDYPITPALNDPNNRLNNYRLTIRYGTLTVTVTPTVGLGGLLSLPPVALPANRTSLMVSADDKARAYRAPNPALTGTITGVKAGDNITATYTTGAAESSPPGTYAITPVLHDPNGKLGGYNVTVRTASLKVQAAIPIRLGSIRYVNNHFQVTGSGDAGMTYRIQASSDLSHWQDVGTAVSNANGEFVFADVSNSGKILFFRIALP